jgi:methanogenic corrinoid protein MtbC1
MNAETLTLRLFEALIDGDRRGARSIVQNQVEAGVSAESLYVDLLWPTHEMIERLFRSDQLSVMAHNMATRLLRVLVDQAASDLINSRRHPDANRVLAMCGPNEQSELGAQIAVDLLEAHGMEVCFAGGGVANDEVLARVNETQPDVLVWFSSVPTDLPAIRQMIDPPRDRRLPHIQIAVGGGVFSRAEGLAEEIGADLWADHPLEMVESLVHDAAHRAPTDQRTVGKIKRYRNAA